MSNIPKVSISFSNGNLLQNIASIDGEAAFIGTGVTSDNLNKVFVINSLEDAETQGITADAEPAAYRQISEFYTELGGNMEIFAILVADTVTMAQMLAATGSPNVAETKAVAHYNATSLLGKTAGDEIVIIVENPNGDEVLGTYIYQAGDVASGSTLAGHLNTAIAANTLGYTSSISGSDITVTAKPGLGATINGSQLKFSFTSGTSGAFFGNGVNTVNGEAPGKKLLDAGEGKIAYLGVFRKPVSGYNAGASFMDSDVSAAVTAAKTFVQAQNSNLKFLRVLIEGRVNDESSTTIFAPNTATNGFAGVVLGSTLNDKSASVGMALGRKVKYACHIKMGKVANGSLTATQIFIGTKLLKDISNLDALHGKGYISFVTYPGKAGFYFGIDNMASADDYSILVHGAVVDAAAKIAALVYIEDLEGEVDTNADGTITDLDAKHLEDRIEQQVSVSLGDRISGFTALVDRTSNIINTNKTNVKLRVRPKGYNTFIDVDLGLTAG